LATQPIELPFFHPIAIRVPLDTRYFNTDAVIALANEERPLAGRILKRANAALSWLMRAETIKNAVGWASSRVISGFLLSLWLHSHACAVGSRRLAESAGNPQGSGAAEQDGSRADGTGGGSAAGNLCRAAPRAGGRLSQHGNMPKIYGNVVANHHDGSFESARGGSWAKGIGLGKRPGQRHTGTAEDRHVTAHAG
jgi:hypothetical protein